MKTTRVLLALFSAMTAAIIASAQVVNFLVISKRHAYVQTDNSTTVDAVNPWQFQANVEGAGGVNNISGITTPTMTIPSGSGSTTLTYNGGSDDNWKVQAAFATQGALDAAYGTGNYSLTALGQTVTPISLTGDTYPLTPLATNLSGGTIVAGVLTWNYTQALIITITGTADHMGIFVDGTGYNGGSEVFGLGTHTFTIPAFSLVAGNSYNVSLDFDDIVGATSPYNFAGTGGMSAAQYVGVYNAQTTFTIQAVPEPATYAEIFGLVALAGVMIHCRRRLA